MTTATILGAGPNGLTAAAVLARAGLDVTIVERLPYPGGAASSGPALGDGTIVDLGAAAHPFGATSPAFRDLGIERHGVEWVHAEYPFAHPLDHPRAAILHRDAERTAAELGVDRRAWLALHAPATDHPYDTAEAIFQPPLSIPTHPLLMARLGARGAWPADTIAHTIFRSGAARALFAGAATHATLALTHVLTGAFGIAFGGVGHATGWPFAKGGTQTISDALLAIARSHGARIELGTEIADLRELPAADVTLLDITPHQLLRLARGRLEPRYARALSRWDYGPGVSKVDWLLDGPVPWRDPRVARAGTVHVGGTIGEIAAAERDVSRGRMPDRPFVLATQPTAADPARAPEGRHILWGYAHVPNAYPHDALPQIETQIERYAPGFRDRIVERVSTPPAMLERWNPNLVGGAIGGGSLGGLQQLFRPVAKLDPYRVSTKSGAERVFLCSSSTPPGGGVTGMSGWHAAQSVLRSLG